VSTLCARATDCERQRQQQMSESSLQQQQQYEVGDPANFILVSDDSEGANQSK